MEQLGIGQVDVGHVGAFGGGGQEHRVPAGELHAEVREEPRVLVVQAVAPFPAVVQVTGHVRVEEGVPFLDRQHHAGEVRQQRWDGLGRRPRHRFGLCRSFRVHASARLVMFGEDRELSREAGTPDRRSLRPSCYVLNDVRHTAGAR